MGMMTDAAGRVLRFVTRRAAPSYGAPGARSAAPGTDIHNDASVASARWGVAYGPARTVAPTGEAAGMTPTPSSAGRGRLGAQAHLDRSIGQDHGEVRQVGFSQGMPYGLVTGDGRGDIAPPAINMPRSNGHSMTPGSVAPGTQSGSDGRVRR